MNGSGVQVFWSIALYLGDGAYQIVKMGVISFTHWMMQRHGAEIGDASEHGKDGDGVRPAHVMPPRMRCKCAPFPAAPASKITPMARLCGREMHPSPVLKHCFCSAQIIQLQKQIACCVSSLTSLPPHRPRAVGAPDSLSPV